MTDSVRSYFLNEIDGLRSNDGIFIVGSTNHLDRLDPGISVSFTSFIPPFGSQTLIHLTVRETGRMLTMIAAETTLEI